jgi:tRNA pseudouridine55 synthase
MAAPAGFIVLDKPTGVTSFSMVALVRRLAGVRRVGHAGTLDPLASGVLPVAVGAATRLIEYTDDETKAYVARIRFGETTDTYDADGQAVARADASNLRPEDIEAALPAFVGRIEQAPPKYSAIKLAGKPLYHYAREGIDLAPVPRTVEIESIELRSFENSVAEVEVRCGKGTYIRSLAHDLGVRLGCGAHLAALIRTRSAGFALDDAHAPEELAALAAEGALDDAILAPDRALERRRAVIIGAGHAIDVAAGRPVTLEPHPGARPLAVGEICRAYDAGGRFLAVLAEAGSGVVRPRKVFRTALEGLDSGQSC